MPRAALFSSLLLHAVFLVAAGLDRSHQVAIDGDPGTPGVVVSFLQQDPPAFDIAPPAPPIPDPMPPPQPSVPAPPSETAPWQVTAAVEAPVKALSAKSSAGTPRAAARPRKSPPGQSQGPRGSGNPGGGAAYTPPQFLTRYKPPYPDAARAGRLEGTVILRVSVDARGHITTVGIYQSSGHVVLDRAAVASVKSWRFEPARSNGTAIAAEVELPVRFLFQERRSG
jgi:protein TonB